MLLSRELVSLLAAAKLTLHERELVLTQTLLSPRDGNWDFHQLESQHQTDFRFFLLFFILQYTLCCKVTTYILNYGNVEFEEINK